jgi:hypothetical protein
MTFIASLCLLGLASEAHAGGYDTPILYTARHMGMGGTAVSYVNDGSSLFHNPAGLGRMGAANVIADFSPIIASLQSSPTPAAMNVQTDPGVGPFFLVGGGVRLHEQITVGLGVYPVASAGGGYEYGDQRDETTLFFLEISPGVAWNAPASWDIGHLSVGASYRVTYVSLSRYRGPQDESMPALLDFSLSGASFTGFRVGAQYSPIPELSFGLHYRHRTDTEVTNDEGVALFSDFRDISTEFTLPSRLSAGVRGDFYGFGVAFDFEYGFQSQNEVSPLTGTQVSSGSQVTVDQYYRWDNAVTLRVGAEYDIQLADSADEMLLTPRLGFVFDGRTANKSYPSAFGTPPAPSYTGTVGVGFDGGAWETNLAYAYRAGSATVTQADIDAADPACMFCSAAGEYEYVAHGIYVDFSYDFE